MKVFSRMSRYNAKFRIVESINAYAKLLLLRNTSFLYMRFSNINLNLIAFQYEFNIELFKVMMV